jgi:hypothetical protein
MCVQWFSDHPEYLGNPFYIGGDSYVGKIVPFLGQMISEGIGRSVRHKRKKVTVSSVWQISIIYGDCGVSLLNDSSTDGQLLVLGPLQVLNMEGGPSLTSRYVHHTFLSGMEDAISTWDTS